MDGGRVSIYWIGRQDWIPLHRWFGRQDWTSKMRLIYLGWMMMVDGYWMIAWRHGISGVGYL
jgi:hypothetical protein